MGNRRVATSDWFTHDCDLHLDRFALLFFLSFCTSFMTFYRVYRFVHRLPLLLGLNIKLTLIPSV